MPRDTLQRSTSTPSGGTAPPDVAGGWYLPVLNYLPFLHALSGIGMGVWLHGEWPRTLLFALAWLYLLPPLLCRLLILGWGRSVGVHSSRDAGFFRWWLITQLQVIYSRFPATEEVLRLVPGLYNFWLRLWGARVSLFAFWSPGVVVMDRQLLEIGPRVVIAPGARIGAHVLQTSRDGRQVLTVAPVRIDAGAMIGIMAGVGPGCHVLGNETVPPRKFLRPFTTWKDGRAQVKGSGAGGDRAPPESR
jgi:hypothetical protein